ncbi:hypothetical protein PC129_g20985 [Phytophthora cactorum]|uniref:Transposable element Tc3 transposase n=1 Tax=Phytophthora cactorum TaxID=29920 RepID=A0A8T0YR95_9STRA|nr:hypothetical protein PC112_g21249 [Phytophthora cactorum]KAG2844976.1 hypothetical protein PC113_g18284 [Phytophthora cactorum]KAG2885595.1 hypothetical protein PC115_g20954 [Phytophthora cactorum]KAG3138454.1 hypothetical protein C6341_g20667 [Phytophthora cactorum]KAG3207985.1 hypothetical protein PC129_g20985 [Phytophthora cactorum]
MDHPGQNNGTRHLEAGQACPSFPKIPKVKKPPSKKTPSSKKKPRLTDRERGKIEGLQEAGLSARPIAKKTGRCVQTVRGVVASVNSSRDCTKPAKTLGRAPALFDRKTHRLVQAAAKGDLSAAKLKEELILSAKVRTIQRTLARVDWLVYAKMVNTLPLKVEDMLTRKAWEGVTLLRKDAGAVWESIIFSDEKKWNLDGPGGFQHYWRDLRKPPSYTKRRQAGGGSVMVWAAFSARGKSPLVVLTGGRTQMTTSILCSIFSSVTGLHTSGYT